ncbi:fork head domain-containing protein, partial [Cantharellus anzutake]|uniref:fork head domain-containing protein n=1 Tax=Cantharellus anzutake TaxID=1750568 RepID=UPI001904BB4E
PRSTEKPPWSYAALIGQAILASKQQKLSLNQIYQYISMAYPYYKKDAPGWRNSIRHNLSLNGSFYKTERSTFKRGKGSLWAIKEEDLECFADGNYIRKGSVAHNRK